VFDRRIDGRRSPRSGRAGGEDDALRTSERIHQKGSSTVAHAEVIESQPSRLDAQRTKENAAIMLSWGGGELRHLRPATHAESARVADFD
jgi:hypothetical protein